MAGRTDSTTIPELLCVLLWLIENRGRSSIITDARFKGLKGIPAAKSHSVSGQFKRSTLTTENTSRIAQATAVNPAGEFAA